MIRIPKVAHAVGDLERPMVLFPSARAAFQTLLERASPARERRVLLPAYVGWSPREGSGVLDPVRALGLDVAFYRVDEHLHVDLQHLGELLAGGPSVLVLIHYFGHVDPGYRRAVELGRAQGALIVEDEAHAMFTDLFGGISGRLGDVCLFSLHKLLPMPVGGALVANPSGVRFLAGLVGDPSIRSPWDFDLWRMAQARRRNAALLVELLAPLAGKVDPLWKVDVEEVPQTFAVRIRGVSRDRLYEQMNAAGFGVVSLYHTMVDVIDRTTFPSSHELARTVMNLPVHQEATPESLVALVEELQRQIQGADVTP